jgi:transposase
MLGPIPERGELGPARPDLIRDVSPGFTGLHALGLAEGLADGGGHRHQEFIRFLNRKEREVPADTAIHAIIDTYAAHRKDKVRAWPAGHPRWTSHFTPTARSWLNAVEGFFANLARRRLKHGVFHSVVDLQAALNRCVREYNADHPEPFSWNADPDAIIAARNRGFQTLESLRQSRRSR